MDRSFGVGVALDVGMYVQSLMLALTARGIATCPQASLRNFPGPIRAVLGIPDELRILCGIAIGYEDPAVAANQARPGREPIESNVVIVRD
jgi:nitroreductase